MLDWHSCQICYPLEIKILLLLLLLLDSFIVSYVKDMSKRIINNDESSI